MYWNEIVTFKMSNSNKTMAAYQSEFGGEFTLPVAIGFDIGRDLSNKLEHLKMSILKEID